MAPRQSVALFVDHDYLFWSFYREGIYPDLKEIVDEVQEKYGRIEAIEIFGDFTKDEMRHEHRKLRTVTNFIIDCSNPESEKDYTDTIMLDHIYSHLIENPKKQTLYVLVTGDGHFHSVVTTLRRNGKEVGIYGVEGATSRQLKECANWSVELQIQADLSTHWPRLLANIKRAQDRSIVPCFSITAERCAMEYGTNEAEMKAALSKLIETGMVDQTVVDRPNRTGPPIKGLFPDWEALEKAGIYPLA